MSNIGSVFLPSVQSGGRAISSCDILLSSYPFVSYLPAILYVRSTEFDILIT
ncbi:hypothetical protein M407DRAFT_245715 [Tulasnella calospora MUT 4182]|uniref:Uncharacterized protein n=1 Tax=Tulasnella calospora MUT 4182 TaxID=1051891 RepID=A0A0C3Q8L3_9AGAM|nr:hypothetical protein M407DRAFT_245715 [Tulasnella calospora MUT 4182]